MCAMRDVDFGAASLHAAAATTILLVVNSALSPTILACQHPKLENNTLSDTGRCMATMQCAMRTFDTTAAYTK